MSDKKHFFLVHGSVLLPDRKADIPVSSIVISNQRNITRYSITVMGEALEAQLEEVIPNEDKFPSVSHISYLGLMSLEEFEKDSETKELTGTPKVPDPLEEKHEKLDEYAKRLQDMINSLQEKNK